jgi:hypothetical protein
MPLLLPIVTNYPCRLKCIDILATNLPILIVWLGFTTRSIIKAEKPWVWDWLALCSNTALKRQAHARVYENGGEMMMPKWVANSRKRKQANIKTRKFYRFSLWQEEVILSLDSR